METGDKCTVATEIETGVRGKALKVPVAKAIAGALEFDWTRFYEE